MNAISILVRNIPSAAVLLLSLVAACPVLRTEVQPNNKPKPGGTIAFIHVNVVPMDRERVLEDQTVVVEGGKIVKVTKFSGTAIPSGARQIEARGKYLIPGLTDAHVHLQTPVEFPVFVANGVTTVFNLDGRPAHLEWKKKIDTEQMQGPTIFTTGPIFRQAHTAEEAVRMVDEQAALGYDGVKIYNGVSKEEYPALIAEAKRKNMLLMGHVARKPDFELTLASGQSIAHLEEYTYSFFNPVRDDNDSHIIYDEKKIPEAVALTVKAGIFVIATLDNYAKIVQQATALNEFLKNPNLQYDAPWVQEGFQPEENRYKNGFDPASYPQLRTSLAFQRKLLKALADGGVPLLCGTDASAVGPVAGFGVHEELQEFVNDGMTPYQALQTATTNPARYFRRSEQSGTIEAGKRADLVLLAGNPLEDIGNTNRIEGVVLGGEWMDKRTLHAELDQVPAEYSARVAEMKALLENSPEKANTFMADMDPYGRIAASALERLVQGQDAKALEVTLRRLREKLPNSAVSSEEALNALGYQLSRKHKNEQAIAALRLNAENYPKSANSWDSLAEVQFKSGDLPHAVENYRRALEVNPKYPNAEVARKFVQEHSGNVH
jgi:imidazolonepropionase-like amidohydrolase